MAEILPVTQTNFVNLSAATIAAALTAVDDAADLFTGGFQVANAGAGYVLLKPIAGSAKPNMRILICGDGTGPDTGQMLSPHTRLANALHIGISFDFGADTLTNPWNGAANPFGVSSFSKFFKCSSTATSLIKLYFVGTKEHAALVSRSATLTYVGIFGACIEAENIADGYAAGAGDGTIGGMLVTAETNFGSSTLTSSTAFPGYAGSGTGPACMFFDPAAANAAALLRRNTVWAALTSGSFEYASGNLRFPSFYFSREAGTNKRVGRLRQFGAIREQLCHAAQADNAAVIKGYCITNSEVSTAEGMVFHHVEPD